jgi:NAD(P)-dependent dehydrogenase (short-subunit alcohol dehydrogenase family)
VAGALRRRRLGERQAYDGDQLRRPGAPDRGALAAAARVRAGRVARAGSGAYSASKFALAGWSDSLWAEEAPHGVHVGLVLPGFISTEGFPQSELTEKPWTRWIVSTPEQAAEAIFQAGVQRTPERYVPRPYGIAAALRVVAPGLVRRVLGGGAASVMTTTTGPDLAERRNGSSPEH